MNLQWHKHGEDLQRTLAAAGIALDQRMAQAWAEAGRYAQGARVSDSHLLLALQRLNARGFDALEISSAGAQWTSLRKDARQQPLMRLSVRAQHVIGHRACPPVFGTAAFIEALAMEVIKRGNNYEARSFGVDTLAHSLTGNFDGLENDTSPLHALLDRLKQAADGTDDFQYAIFLEGGKMRLGVTSTLGHYVEEENGLLVPNKAILTHFGEFGLFTGEQLGELNDLINSASTQEDDLQKFFERNPHFLREGDYREVHPHVHLTREDAGDLIPDFILTNTKAQKAALAELKLPKPKLIAGSDNRRRFAHAIMEAKAQLDTYREWFDESRNRESLKDQIGMQVYKPRLMVIIGRASEFRDEIDRQRLASRHPDLEIVTYDDIVDRASRRLLVINGQI